MYIYIYVCYVLIYIYIYIYIHTYTYIWLARLFWGVAQRQDPRVRRAHDGARGFADFSGAWRVCFVRLFFISFSADFSGAWWPGGNSGGW